MNAETREQRFNTLDLVDQRRPPMYVAQHKRRAEDVLTLELEAEAAASENDSRSTDMASTSRHADTSSSQDPTSALSSGGDSSAGQCSGSDDGSSAPVGSKRPRRLRAATKKSESAASADGAGEQEAEDEQEDSASHDSGSQKKRRRTSTQSKPRRQWNRENARRSRMRKRLMVESMAVRMEELREQVMGMRAMIGRAGLEEDWQAWAKQNAPKYVQPSSASLQGLSSIQMPGEEPGKLEQLAVVELARKAVKQAREEGTVQGTAALPPNPASTSSSSSSRLPSSSSLPLSSSSSSSAPAPQLPVLPSSVDGMVMVDGSMVPQSLMAPRDLSSATQLHDTDYALIDSINTSRRHFLITDPLAPDNPIVFASSGFFALTGYPPQEVLGRNCRMLQGPETDPAAVDEIRMAVRQGADAHVVLLNYRRDGTPFWNDLFVAPLRDPQGRVVHFVGVQCEVTPSRAQALLELKRQSQANDMAAMHARMVLQRVAGGMATSGPVPTGHGAGSGGPAAGSQAGPSSGRGKATAPHEPAVSLRGTGSPDPARSRNGSMSKGFPGASHAHRQMDHETDSRASSQHSGSQAPAAASTWSTVGGVGAPGGSKLPAGAPMRMPMSVAGHGGLPQPGAGAGAGAVQTQGEGIEAKEGRLGPARPSNVSDLDGEDMFRHAVAAQRAREHQG